MNLVHEIERKFQGINCWRRGAIRAPHKPLLLIFALGRCQRGEPRLISYRDLDPELTRLLRDFGPSRKTYHTEYPFSRLRNDGVWELEHAENCQSRASNADPKKSELIKHDVKGGLKKDIYEVLREDHALLFRVAEQLLNESFSESLHSDILSAVGLELQIKATRRRSPEFRKRVLAIYDYRCAVCGYGIRSSDAVIGLEAAHIKWYQAGGPDLVQNGLALCSLHHKLFDYGAFTLTSQCKITLSCNAHGEGLDQHLLKYHGEYLRPPHSREQRPKEEFVTWHEREVFKKPARQA